MNGNRRIAINSIIIFIRLCFVSLITVILSRVVLDALGASDFGLYNVVGGIVLLLSVLNSSMASTTYRYLAFELGKGAEGDTNKVFNTSIVIHICFAAIIIVIGIPIGNIYIYNFLNVPQDRISDACFVFHLSVIAAAINTILVPFQGLLVAYEKFYANAIIDIITNLIKLGVILLFIYSDTNRLRLYSIIMLGYTIVSCFAYVYYCWQKHRDVILFHFHRNKALYKEMLSFSGWTLFGAVANVGKTQGSAVVINYFFGTLVNAAYAIAHQVEVFVLMFARSLNTAAVPQTTKSYSGGDESHSIYLTSYVCKYTFLLMAFISFPLLIEMDFLLDLWLKEVPQGASVFCKFIILANLLGCLGEGIPNLINASGRIKAYQIVVHSVLISGLPIACVFYYFGGNMYTIVIVFCVISLINSFVKLAMLRRVVKFDVFSFMKISHFRIFLMAIPLSLFYYIKVEYVFPQSFWGHVAILFLGMFLFIIIVAFLGLDESEKAKVKRYVDHKFK